MTGGILYLDPSLGVASGHHLPLAHGFTACLGAQKITFAGAKSARGANLPSASAPVFGHRIEDAFRVARYGSAWMGKGVAANAARAVRRVLPARAAPAPAARATPLAEFAFKAIFEPLGAEEALRSLLNERTSWASIVSLAVDPATLSALHTQRALFDREDAPSLHLVFLYPENEFLGAKTEQPYFDLVRNLMRCRKPPRLYAELEEHARDLRARLNVDVAHQLMPYRSPVAPTSPDGPFTVAVLGAGRRDKAFAALPEIVAAASARAPDLRFRIQRPMPREGLASETGALAANGAVTLLPDLLSDADYEAELAGAHVILLPYEPDRYARRGSGVFVEALLFGKPIVCTAGTALARALRGNGVTGNDPAGLASALLEAQRNYASLAVAAQTMRAETMAAITDGPLMQALRAEQG